MDDAAALGRYAGAGDEAAFGQLVERYIDLVYAAARRQVGDPGRAQDVTQAVFILLARKAGRLAGRGDVGGWLIQATHYVCRDARKRERRRRFHEGRAHMMKEERAAMEARAAQEADGAWEAIRPLLDEAMMGLGGAARTAIVLRYLENRPLKEVGAALGISEEAARKRVDRGIDQLRRVLTGKGVAVPTGLGAVLMAKAAEAAPAGVAAAVMGTATPVVGALAASGGRLLLWAQMKLAVAAGVIIVVAAAAVPLVSGGGAGAGGAAAGTVAAGGANTAGLRATATAGEAGTIMYRGVVVDAAGKPVANAAVRTYISNDISDRLEKEGKTGADGTFALGPLPVIDDMNDQIKTRIIMFDAAGFGLAWRWEKYHGRFDDLEAIRMTLGPATEVTGTVTNGRGEPIANAVVEAAVAAKDRRYFRFNGATGLGATTDGQGRYRIGRIPEGLRLQLTVRHADYQTWSTQFLGRNMGGTFPVAAGTADADIQLADRPARIRAQLTQGGKPLMKPGVELGAFDRSIIRTELAHTDASGRAEFTGLSAGTWELLTPWALENSHESIVPVEGIGLQLGETREVAAELGTILVRGTVFEGDTTMPGRCSVSVNAIDSKRSMAGGYPDAKGRFEILLPAGRYHLSCYSWEDGAKSSVDVGQDFVLPTDSAGLNLTLRGHSGSMLRGQLVDSSGKPLPGLVVLDFQTAVAGIDGRFSLRADSNPTSQMIGVAVDSKRTLARGFTVNSTTPLESEMRLVLEPMGTITGRAVDRAGRPLPDTAVSIDIPEPSGGSVSFPEWIWHTTMEDDGTFRITHVPVGYRLDIGLKNRFEWSSAQVALRAGETRDLGEKVLHGPIGTTYATVMAERTLRPDPTLVLPPREAWDATITARLVHEDGKPVVGMTLYGAITGDNGPTVQYFEHDQVTDMKGRFTLGGVPHNRTVRLYGNAPDGSGRYRWDVTPGTPVELRLSAEAKAAATRP